MRWYDFVWNFEPGGNVSHVAEHGITIDGRLVVVVYEMLDSVTVFPITAFEVEP